MTDNIIVCVIVEKCTDMWKKTQANSCKMEVKLIHTLSCQSRLNKV